MWYAVISEDVDDSLEKRPPVRERHLARLEALRDEGRLLVAGPHPAVDSEDPATAGFTGSLIIAEFASLAEAKQWAAEDPYTEAGVYSSTVVKPFRRVLP